MGRLKKRTKDYAAGREATFRIPIRPGTRCAKAGHAGKSMKPPFPAASA
jgi:hypothetical protein